jgi:hypothetical protein
LFSNFSQAVNHFETWQSYLLLGGVGVEILSVGRTAHFTPLAPTSIFFGQTQGGEIFFENFSGFPKPKLEVP